MSIVSITTKNKINEIKQGFIERLKNEFTHGTNYNEVEEAVNQFLVDYPEEEKTIKEIVSKRTSNILKIKRKTK